MFIKLNKINRERWNRFKANKRGFISLWIFSGLFILSLFAEFIANDKPLLINFDKKMLWPIIHFSYRTINFNLPSPAPSPPTLENWLGTDNNGKDVVALLIYGFRISVLFGLVLTFFSSY